MENQPKQVIVVRNDLNMRKGKIAAQVAHASLACIINHGNNGVKDGKLHYMFDPESAMGLWLLGPFKKICVYVESEKELDMVYSSAVDAGLPCALIVDSGLTEFHGVATKTCVGIGPDFPGKIDLITGHLKLL